MFSVRVCARGARTSVAGLAASAVCGTNDSKRDKGLSNSLRSLCLRPPPIPSPRPAPVPPPPPQAVTETRGNGDGPSREPCGPVRYVTPRDSGLYRELLGSTAETDGQTDGHSCPCRAPRTPQRLVKGCCPTSTNTLAVLTHSMALGRARTRQLTPELHPEQPSALGSPPSGMVCGGEVRGGADWKHT